MPEQQLGERARAPVVVETGEAHDPERPAAWIGNRDDFDADQRFGGWVDACQPVADVMADVRKIIDRTPDGLGKRWNICDLRGFGAWTPDDDEGLPAVLNVARGIAIYGLAYSALAAQLGADSNALRLDRYPLSYIGDWPSIGAFAEQVARESGWSEHLERLPKSMRPYVQLDVKRLARDARRDLTVIAHEAGVWVYDPRVW